MSGEWDDLEGEMTTADEVARLKTQLVRVNRQLHEVKHKHADYLETVRQAVVDSVGQIDLAPVSGPEVREETTVIGEEYAVALLSDLQTGKVTPDYNTEVCRERVMRYAEKIVRITEVQRRHHPVRHLVVPLLGDAVEGIGIFPGQQWLIDSTLYAQVFKSTPTIIVDFVRYLLQHFETVTIEAVQGNHGRLGRKGEFGPEDNSDRMVYFIVQLLLRDEPRFTMNMADPSGERAWYKIMEIGNYKALLIHGDQIRGSMGFPWYGLGKKINSWASGGLGGDSDFRDVMMGHYHTPAMITLNKRLVWANGSTESTNTFAAEVLASQGDPVQLLLFVDPEKGFVTGSYAVRLLA